jgi:hypothetical protein
VFSAETSNGYVPPVYAIADRVDNCNFAADTTWSQGEAGRTFRYHPRRPPGMQYIHDATDLRSIRDGAYDFVLASHVRSMSPTLCVLLRSLPACCARADPCS